MFCRWSLQVNFQRFLGTSPMAYLRNMRLEGANRDIAAAAGASVGEIARRWGFVHLGRFAQDYHAAFGTSPSAHLKRGRAKRRL